MCVIQLTEPSIMNINHPSRLKLAFCAAGLALLISAATSVRASELSWQTDFTQASQQAAQQHKYMLLDFTGSDWCPWCIKMDKEVFSQSQFSDFALKNLILVKLDFPRKTAQSSAEKNQTRFGREIRYRGVPDQHSPRSERQRSSSPGGLSPGRSDRVYRLARTVGHADPRVTRFQTRLRLV